MKEGLQDSGNIVRIKFNPALARFVVLFLIFLSPFYFLSIEFESMIPLFSMQATTQAFFLVLKAFGINSNISGIQISYSSFSLQIVRQCTGIFEVIAVSSCILAFPAAMKKKAVGILIALPAIYIFNMIRLLSLAFLGIYNPNFFETVHDYILQITFFAFVIVLWYLWIEKVVRKNAQKAK